MKCFVQIHQMQKVLWYPSQQMQDWSRTCRRPAIYTENLRHKVVGMQKSVDEKRKIINKNKREYNVSPKESIRQQNGRNKHVSQIESRHAYQKNGEMSTTARGATQARSTWTEESLELKKERENVLSVSQRLLQLEKLHKEQEFRWNDEKSELLTEIRTFKSKEQEARQQKMHYQKKINNQAVESQFYRERIKVLEKANERETKRRFQMEETIDELRSEMDKIRALFIKQEQGFQQRERIEKQKHEAMLEKLQLEVQKTREELHHERQCRLEEQLNRSEQKLDISKPGASSSSSPQASKSTLDVSYFLNNSAHLPDKVKGIMEEWRLKMEEALLESEKPRPDSGKAGSLLPNDREDVTREKRCKHCTATVWPKSTYVQEYTSACSSDMEPLEVRDANDSNMPPPLDDSEEVRQGITLQVNGQQHKSSTRTMGTNTVHSQHSDTGMRCNEAKYSADSFPDYDPRQKITEWEDRLQAENSHEYKELDPGVRDKLKDGRVTYPVLDVIQDSDLQLCKDIQMWYNPGHFS